MANNENENIQTESAAATGAVTFEDMADEAVEQILAHNPDAETDTDTSAPGPPVTVETTVDGTPTDVIDGAEDLPSEQAGASPPPAAEEDAAPGPAPTVGSLWAHVPEALRQKVLATARKADDQRAAPAAKAGPGTDQAPAADADTPVVDVAEEVLTGTLSRDEVTEKIDAVRMDGYDDLADALEATVDFAAQQTREGGDAARAVVDLVEAIDGQQATEQKEEVDIDLFVAALNTRPGASDDQLILVRRMVVLGVVTPGEGENPYELAFQQLEAGGMAAGGGERGEAETPNGESTARRDQRKLAAAAGSSSDGGAETLPDLAGFDTESVQAAMEAGHPLFAGLQEQQ